MKAIIALCSVAFFVGCLVDIGDASTPTDPYCRGVSMSELRIQGCDAQPCKIKKGDPLPFEIDFLLNGTATSAEVVRSSVFIDYYSVPPPAYGTFINDANCRDENVGLECPIASNVTHTFKSTVFIDSNAECHFGCDGMGPGGTGVRGTSWSVGTDDGVCIFQVLLDITE